MVAIRRAASAARQSRQNLQVGGLQDLAAAGLGISDRRSYSTGASLVVQADLLACSTIAGHLDQPGFLFFIQKRRGLNMFTLPF